MKRYLELIRKALYGHQTNNPIVTILKDVDSENTNHEIVSAQINTDIIDAIRRITTNLEVINARGDHSLLQFRLDAIERDIKYVRDFLGMDEAVVVPEPKKEYTVTYIITRG